MVDDSSAPIGVIGGSGFYSFLHDVHEVAVDTPYGAPSEPVAIGAVGGRPVAFLPRHGREHRLPPHRVPYRANLWALRSVGARQVVGISAVGSLRADWPAGTLVVPDQVVDRTSGRDGTYYDGPPAKTVHVAFSDPYCPIGRSVAVKCARDRGWEVADGGTLVTIDGPRFASRAESRWYAAQGWSIIGMTASPEAALARELALCYSLITLVTDLDAGLVEGEGVTQEEVFVFFGANVARLRDAVADVVQALPANRDCPCPHALDGLDTGVDLP